MIRIGFSTERASPLSWLIRTLTDAPYSHVFVVVDDSTLGALVLEASWLGFRAIGLDRFAATSQIVEIVSPVGLDERAGLRAAAAWLGEPYAYTSLVGMVAVLAGRWLRRKVRNPLRSSKALFCAEAVVRFLAAAGYPGAAGIEAESATPGDVRRLLG